MESLNDFLAFYQSGGMPTLIILFGFFNHAIQLGVLLAFVGLFLEKRHFDTTRIPWKRIVLIILCFVADAVYLIIIPKGLTFYDFLFRITASLLLRSLYTFALYKAPLFSLKRLSAITTVFGAFSIRAD